MHLCHVADRRGPAGADRPDRLVGESPCWWRSRPRAANRRAARRRPPAPCRRRALLLRLAGCRRWRSDRRDAPPPALAFTVASPSAWSWRRSEWPTMTWPQPRSASLSRRRCRRYARPLLGLRMDSPGRPASRRCRHRTWPSRRDQASPAGQTRRSNPGPPAPRVSAPPGRAQGAVPSALQPVHLPVPGDQHTGSSVPHRIGSLGGGSPGGGPVADGRAAGHPQYIDPGPAWPPPPAPGIDRAERGPVGIAAAGAPSLSQCAPAPPPSLCGLILGEIISMKRGRPPVPPHPRCTW